MGENAREEMNYIQRENLISTKGKELVVQQVNSVGSNQ